MTPPGPRLALGRWRLLDDLGGRRLGRLYAARDERTGAAASVLLLDALLERRFFLAERARVSLGNAHPGVLGVLDAGPGAVVLEPVDGRDARAVVRDRKSRGPVSFAVGAHIGARVASAVAWAHARGTAHGFFGPEDVFVQTDASVKLLGLFCGSPTPLASPEESDDTRGDVAALGVLVFRLVTSTSPYATAVSSPALGHRAPRAEPLAPEADAHFRSMPRRLGEICRAALRRETPAAAVEAELASLASSLPGADSVQTTLFLLSRRSAPAPSPSPSAAAVPTGTALAAVPASRAIDTLPAAPPRAGDVAVSPPPSPPSSASTARKAPRASFPPPLRAAARHRAERGDVTTRLVDEEAHALADLAGLYRRDATWWIEEGESGRSRGPVTLEELRRRAQGGVITARSLVWCSGMERWRELRHLDVAAGLRLFARFSPPAPPRAQQPEDSLPNTIWDYEIVRRLGDGGQGVVYLARDPTNGYDVALKSIPLDSEGARARFEREVRAVIGMQGHPHITQLHRWRIDAAQRRGFLAFSYIPGRSLAEIMAADGRRGLDLERAVELAEHIALGLAKLHELDFIHRDLKPQNVMVRADPGHETAVLIDLGIAKLLNVSSTSTNMGSPAYAAPERFRADARVDHRSDLYSLGLILFEMLTGRPAFPAKDLLELAIAHAQRPPPDPRSFREDLPESLVALTLRLLEKGPADRPDCATVVVERLREARRTRWTARARPRRTRIISDVLRLLRGSRA